MIEHAHLRDPSLYERFYNVDYEPGEATMARPGEPRLQWAVEHISRDARVLDAGCYKGSVAIPLWQQRRDLRILGVDISSRAIADAREFAELLDVPIGFRVANAERLPFHDGMFGAVLLFELLEHVVDPSIVIAEAQRVCATGGVILISSPVGAVDMEVITPQRIAGFEQLRQHVREYDPSIELAGWPGMVSERRAAADARFVYHLAVLPQEGLMPATSKAQFRFMQAVASGTAAKKGGLTRAKAKEFVSGQSPKGLPNKAKKK